MRGTISQNHARKVMHDFDFHRHPGETEEEDSMAGKAVTKEELQGE